MNKKGFTLIELLAVIVILAIIAVIAVPIVLNIIDESKDNATLRSADFYLDAAEMAVANSTLKDKNIADDEYDILPSGNICLKYKSDNTTCDDELAVEVNGEVPTSGTITIENGNITGVNLFLNGKTIRKNDEGKLVYDEGKAESQTTYYTDEEIAANDLLFGIGVTTPNSVVAAFNEDYTEVIISKNGDDSDGKAGYILEKIDEAGVLDFFALEKATVLEGITELHSTFYNAMTMNKLELPDSLQVIGDFAFNSCYGYKNMIIPKNVTSIGESAFEEVPTIETIYIPASVTSMGNRAFDISGDDVTLYCETQSVADLLTDGVLGDYEINVIVDPSKF